MLKRFSVEGFKNFEKKVTIDFSDVRDYKFHPECVTDGVLNTAIIYGKNAVGKSNFGLALFDIVSHLTMNNVTPGLYEYYLNVNNKNGYAEFEYVFQFGEDEIIYRYGKSGDKKDFISPAYLQLNSKVLIDNKGGMDDDVDGLRELAPHLIWENYHENSALKYFLYNTSLDDNHPLRKMLKFINNMLWFRSLDENRFIGYKEKSNDYYTFIFEEPTYIDEFNGLLKQSGVDHSIVAKKDVDGEIRLYFDTKTPMPFHKVAWLCY